MSKEAVSAASSEQSIEKELFRKAAQKEKIINFLPLAGLIGVIIIFTVITKGQFIGVANLASLINQCFIMVIVIIGGSFLYSIGGLDMSIGAVMALSAMVIAMLYNDGCPLVLAFLAGMIISIVCMCVTAFSRSYLHVEPFVASMCVMNFCQGIVMYIVTTYGRASFSIAAFPWLEYTATKIIVLLVLLAIGYVLFTYSTFGKSLRAVGGNPRVAKISGIHVERTTILAYIVMGIMIAIGALFTLSRGGVADTTVGGGMHLNVMTAIVLGGFPLEGGARAKFSSPIIGALLVTCLTNGLGILGQANFLGFAIKGVLFIAVIGLTYDKSKGKLIS